MTGETRVAEVQKFKEVLSGFSKHWTKREEGPFLDGKTTSYADLIVGGWLQMLKKTMPEWEEIREWDERLWGKLDEALVEYAELN